MEQFFKTVYTDEAANELLQSNWKLELLSHQTVRNDLESVMSNGYYDWKKSIKKGLVIDGSYAGSSKVITVYTFSKVIEEV